MSERPRLFLIAQPSSAAAAQELITRIAGLGVDAWHGSLAPTGRLADDALARLRASAAVALLFDAQAAASREVDRHLLVARQEGKPIIPVRLANVDEGLLRQELLDAEWIDGRASDAAAALAVRVFHAASGRLLVDRPMPSASPGPTNRTQPILLATCAAALIGILSVLVLLALRPTTETAIGPTSTTPSTMPIRPAAPDSSRSSRDALSQEPDQQDKLAMPRGPNLSAEPNAEPDWDDLAPTNEPPSGPPTSIAFDPLATARLFYNALGRGDGMTAATFVVPWKRSSGPLSGIELTRYYSRLRQPLRLRNLHLAGASAVLAEYDFVLSDGRTCRGTAAIELVKADDGSAQIGGIRTAGPC